MVKPFMKRIIYSVLLILVAFWQGCSKVPDSDASAQEFQEFYNRTSWYWSRYVGLPEEINGYAINDHGMQAFLKSPSGAQMIYGERTPSRGMKSFRGLGNLKTIPNNKEPIFEIKSDYTVRNPDKILLIGFVHERVFTLEATHNETNRQEVFREAIDVAKRALEKLREQQ